MRQKEKGPAIGIDLGTTYSCVAVWQHGRVEIITNDQGNRTTPSCVAFTSTEHLVGDAAKNQATINASNTIFGLFVFLSYLLIFRIINFLILCFGLYIYIFFFASIKFACLSHCIQSKEFRYSSFYVKEYLEVFFPPIYAYMTLFKKDATEYKNENGWSKITEILMVQK